MYGDVGRAVPKTTETRYMDGSVQATQMTTQVTPSLLATWEVSVASKYDPADYGTVHCWNSLLRFRFLLGSETQ